MIDGIEKIKQKLAEELAAKELFIKERTEQQIAAILEQAEQTIASERQEQEVWRAKYREQEAQRSEAKGNIERKKIRLEMNQQLIDELLYKLEQQLINMSDARKLDLYLAALPERLEAPATLLLSERDKPLLANLQATLLAKDDSWRQADFACTTEISGGVLLRGTEISEDHSFAELLRAKKYELLQIIKQNLLHEA